MEVSINWLKELVDLKVPIKELIRLLPLRTIGTKEITDRFIELDMKGYNRADLLSMRGVAREVAAITDSKVTFADVECPKYDLPKAQAVVENQKLAPVYCVAKIGGLKVDQSPKEWLEKLEACGIRSVNNVADVTNLIMLEFGQPMHAFDARGVKDETVIVRQAKKGERITTLDGKTRDLALADLLIADPLNALGIAGVMGGKDSEISDSTTTILLEAAIFDPVSIRKTSQRHGLPSEASKRFQHGLTKTNLLQALAAAIKMYEGLGGKLTAISLVGNLEDKPKTIQLTQEKINSLLGTDIPANQVESSLKRLGFHLEGVNVNSWEVKVPYFRLDIDIEEDVIEEVARMYGYEKIPSKELVGKIPQKTDQRLFEFIYDLKAVLVEQGLTEVQTYSFVSTQLLDLGFQAKQVSLRIANPISSETEYLRQWISPNLLEAIGRNLRKYQKINEIQIFEIGKCYYPKKNDLPREPYKLAIAVTEPGDLSLPKLYQLFTKAMEKLGIKGIQVKTSKPGEELKGLFHPVRFADIFHNTQDVGGLAEVHPKILDALGITQRVAILEIELDPLI